MGSIVAEKDFAQSTAVAEKAQVEDRSELADKMIMEVSQKSDSNAANHKGSGNSSSAKKNDEIDTSTMQEAELSEEIEKFETKVSPKPGVDVENHEDSSSEEREADKNVMKAALSNHSMGTTLDAVQETKSDALDEELEDEEDEEEDARVKQMLNPYQFETATSAQSGPKIHADKDEGVDNQPANGEVATDDKRAGKVEIDGTARHTASMTDKGQKEDLSERMENVKTEVSPKPGVNVENHEDSSSEENREADKNAMKAALSNPDDKIDKLQGIMRKVFDRADTNRSGTLTTDEVRMPMTYLLSCRRGLSMVCCAGISLSEATWMERRYSSERVSVLGR